MRRICYIAAGVLLLIGSLWIGAYAIGTLPDRHWAIFPTIATTAIGVAIGWLIAWLSIWLVE